MDEGISMNSSEKRGFVTPRDRKGEKVVKVSFKNLKFVGSQDKLEEAGTKLKSSSRVASHVIQETV